MRRTTRVSRRRTSHAVPQVSRCLAGAAVLCPAWPQGWSVSARGGANLHVLWLVRFARRGGEARAEELGGRDSRGGTRRMGSEERFGGGARRRSSEEGLRRGARRRSSEEELGRGAWRRSSEEGFGGGVRRRGSEEGLGGGVRRRGSEEGFGGGALRMGSRGGARRRGPVQTTLGIRAPAAMQPRGRGHHDCPTAEPE
jgi:hypothetical protein